MPEISINSPSILGAPNSLKATENIEPGRETTIINPMYGLSDEEYNDPNKIQITIADKSSPLFILFGPPACGKTMTLMRMTRFLNRCGYRVAPIRSFRPAKDSHYQKICDNYNEAVNSQNAANSTDMISFMLVEIIKDGKRVCQILEAPGEYYFDPQKPQNAFPRYVQEIIHLSNRKVWVTFVEPDWLD